MSVMISITVNVALSKLLSGHDHDATASGLTPAVRLFLR